MKKINLLEKKILKNQIIDIAHLNKIKGGAASEPPPFDVEAD